MNIKRVTAIFNDLEAKTQEIVNKQEIPVISGFYNMKSKDILYFYNSVEKNTDPMAHAEMNGIKYLLSQKQSKYLDDYICFINLEPCPLCAAALASVRINAIYFGAYDPKTGGVIHGPRIFEFSHHKPEIIGGFMENDFKILFSNYFKKLRSN